MAERPVRVLFVEDSEEIAELALMGLESDAALEVWHCSTGQGAIDSLEIFTPDICLLDVKLPDIDGLETLRRIRQIPRLADMPAVFLTAKSQVHAPEDYQRRGAVALIIKPFDPRRLGPTIYGVWDMVRMARAAGTRPPFLTQTLFGTTLHPRPGAARES